MRDRVTINPATTTAWQRVAPATITERRAMKILGQPEHSYTGHIPMEPEHTGDMQHEKKLTPVLGYTGHLRHREDHIGNTFTRNVEVAKQSLPDNATQSGNSNQHKHVTFTKEDKVVIKSGQGLTAHSGYGEFDNASGYGEFMAKPNFSTRSGYGVFENASGYGEFAAKPMSARSGYGAFDGASGYGEFAAKPMSERSGYGAFDGASGYGEFATKPMSARSGYGAFDGASGYGEFVAKPMSERSGYGAFDGASGYGEFAAKPMSARSGYGAFDGASGYGEFMEAPPHDEYPDVGDEYVNNQRSGSSLKKIPGPHDKVSRQPVRKVNQELDRQYQRALLAVGGKKTVERLLDAFAKTITQRHHKRTELLQTLKRNFEKYEQTNHGQMTKSHLKEALLGLSCVFSDDQIMALMSLYDPECRGTVAMDDLIVELAKRC